MSQNLSSAAVVIGVLRVKLAHEILARPLVKSGALLKIYFLISQPKHMLWVLKRTVSMRRFFLAPKTYVSTDRQENIDNFTYTFFVHLYLCFGICCIGIHKVW